MEKELETGEKTENKTDNKTEQNNRRYKAFISYRHQPFDRKVAVTLQKHLETFHPPKQLEKKEKWRVFRDETELPTSADLSQDIREALENSEYLIVICSSMLVQSKWCREEISYFKSLHNNSTQNILALLIEGNPGEVFPEELCWSEEIRKNAEGEEIREKIEVEPLAANITADSERKSLKKLKTEYLRIAAPLLDCRYDDLYQREQKRKIHRSLAVMGGVTVVVGGIGIYSSIMAVRLNEQKRLLQEENYNRMAVQSDYMWEDGKVTEAIETAVDALPDAEDNMSVFSAEKATAEKLGLFQRENFLPVQKYETTSYITKVAFVNSGKNVVAQDATGVYLWETKSGKLVKKYTVEELGIKYDDDTYSVKFFVPKKEPLKVIKLEKVSAEGNGQSDGELTSEMMLYGYKKTTSEGEAENPCFYLISVDQVWKVNPADGSYERIEEVSEEEKKWHYDSDTYTYSYRMFDGKIARIYEEYEEAKKIPGMWNQTGNCSLIVFDENNIENKKEYKYTKEWDDLFDLDIQSISDKICYVNETEYKEGGNCENKIKAYSVKDGVILKDEKPLLEETVDQEKEGVPTVMHTGDYLITETNMGTQGEYTKYRMFDYNTAKKLSEVTVNGSATYMEDLAVGTFKKENTENYTDILFTVMTKEIYLIDVNTGDVIYEYTFPSSIINIDYTEAGQILVTLENGKEYMLFVNGIEKGEKEKSVGAVIHEFASEIDASAWYNDDELAVSGNVVYRYQDLTNESCEIIEEEDSLIYQTKDKNVKYSDDTKSKKIKPVIEKLQEKNLVSSVFWSHKIGDYVYLFGRDGILYKVNKNSDGIEEQITIKEKKEDDAEKSEYVVVWKTQNPDEILLQNQEQAWLINLDKMEIRYEIGDNVKGQFAGYSQKENKVLMKNWLEEKYWICPLYTAEELKELGTKWKNQAE